MHTTRDVGEQNAVADDADGAKQDTEEAALLRAVRDKGDGHVRGSTEEVARHGEELDLCGAPVSQAVDDSRQERREAWWAVLVHHGTLSV